MIPFSFVVDWVLNTDKWFEALHLDELGSWDVRVDIIDTCVTYKVKRDTSFRNNRLGPRNWDRNERLFYRWVGEDAWNALDWDLKIPSFMQFLLGASLVAAH
jgi:hypothetical protein